MAPYDLLAQGTETRLERLGRGTDKPEDGSFTLGISFNSALKTGKKRGGRPLIVIGGFRIKTLKPSQQRKDQKNEQDKHAESSGSIFRIIVFGVCIDPSRRGPGESR
jgi:hypothetical protein